MKHIVNTLVRATLLWTLLCISVCAATTIKFTLVRDYLIVIRLTIPGTESCEFLLDTGANTTLVTPEFAQKLGLRPLDRIELVTVAGNQIIPRTKLKSLALGGKTFKDVEVLISELQTIRSVRPTICGVLGQNVLTQLNYLVDFQKQQILVEDTTELENKMCGDSIPLEIREGRAMVRTRNNWRMVLDSGIAMLSLFDASQRIKEQEFRSVTWRPMLATSDLGSRKVWHGQLPMFKLGQIALRDVPVTLFEIQASKDGRDEDGLLPLRLFHSLYFNHRRKLLLLNPLSTTQ